jgi:hypothetical protein
MRYLYQKDERALPRNLLNRIYRFFPSFLNKCSVFHYFATSLSLSLSLSPETVREPRGRGTSAVGNRYQATANEDSDWKKYFLCVIVIFNV